MGKGLQQHIVRAIVTVFFIIYTVALSAQNNQYRMDDGLFKLYEKAYKERKTLAGKILADTIIERAKAIGDRNGEITAMTILLLYNYYQEDNMPAVEREAKKLMDKATAYEKWTYYYFAAANLTNYYIREKRYLEAYTIALEQRKIAEKDNHLIGIRDSYYSLATIQQYRGEYARAIDNYREYIKYSKDHNIPSNFTDTYANICDCLRKTQSFRETLQEVKEAWAECKSDYNRFDIKLQECYALFMLGRYDDFRKEYNYLKQHEAYDRDLHGDVKEAVETFKKMLDGKDQEVLETIKRLKEESELEGYRLAVAYYKYKGDYAKAVKNQWMLIDVYGDYAGELVQNDDRIVKNMSNIQQHEREVQQMDYQNTQLAMANAQLSLNKSTLELNKSQDNAQLAQLQADRNKLNYQNQQLESQRLQNKLEQENKTRQAEAEQYRLKKEGMALCLTFVVLIAISFTLYAIIRWRHGRQLKQGIRKLRESISLLNTAKLRASESELTKTRFIQNMSHEIRTPLNAIVGFSNVLVTMGNELSEAESQELTQYITTNSELLTTLVNDILDLTNLQSGNFVMTKEIVKVNELCRETMETVRHRLAGGVTLTFETELNEDFEAVTDRKRVQQVLINLLTNAEKNTEKGSIILSCIKIENTDMISFTVTDTGIGIPVERMDEIFQRYKKLDDKKQGSGLGLDICRTIAKKLNGEINIDRQYTNGARFYFNIPYNA